MLTDQEILEEAGRALKVDTAQIRPQVELYRRQGVAKIYARTKPYWIKARGEIALAAADYLIHVPTFLPDCWQIRHLRTTDQRLEIMSEGKFIKKYPDDTGTGSPRICVALDAEHIQLYPRSDTARTLYVNYFYQPSLNTIAEIPPVWQHAVLDYILAMIWKDDNEKMVRLKYFERWLDDIATMAKPVVDEAIDIESNPMLGISYSRMEDR